jgi:8-oxo-dGTP pyrophosphatase MutT (NUDIX family)
MLQKIIGKIWKTSPQIFRAYFVRLTQKTFTVSVGAIVTNDEGKVLLLDHVLRPGSGWGVPGGFINHNEQPAEAAKREICEEIGLEIDNLNTNHQSPRRNFVSRARLRRGQDKKPGNKGNRLVCD